MKFYPKLYIGDGIKNPNWVKQKLKMRISIPKVYLISLANNSDQLDIFHASQLKQKYISTNSLYIIGIASTYPEAIQLVVDLTKEVVAATGGANIKTYLLKKIKECTIT